MTLATVQTLAPGDELEPLVLPPITRATLALFAGASGDHNPIHIDIDFAQAAGMPDVFAHGMLSMGYLSRLLTERFPAGSLREFKVRFAALTLVHDVIVCRGRVRNVETIERARHVTLDLEATVPKRGITTLTGHAVLALPF